MPNGPNDPTARTVRNLLDLAGITNGFAARYVDFLVEMFDDVAAQIMRVDPTRTGAGRQARLARLFDAISERVDLATNDAYRDLRSQLAELGAVQSQHAGALLKDTVGAVGVSIDVRGVGVNRFKAVVDSDPLRGAILREWADVQAQRTVFEITRQVRLGVGLDETIDQIVRRVRGRHVGRGRFTGGVAQMTTRGAKALVRTAVTHISNEALFQTFAQNDGVTKKYRYTATLDSRTTIICASLDGNEYRYDDESAPRPPQHWGCRSTIVPVVDWAGLGIRPPPIGQRASIDGPIRADVDYESWLRRQPVDVQNDVLGVGRARLWRAGKVTLRDMVRDDRSIVTLAELERRVAA